MRQQWLVFLPMTLATAGLAACASVLGGEEVKVRPIDMLAASASGGAPRDTTYESAVAAINERDYGRALDYLQAAKAKDPRNVKALNALGVVYDKLGRFDLSARYYAQARAIEPDSKIVAENMGYSQVLQRLLNPNQPVAVATIDLPPDLIKPASAAASSPAAEKTTIATAAPAMPVTERKVIDTVPHVAATMLDAKPSFASVILPEPVMPVTERKVIDTTPHVATAMLETKPSFAPIVLPEPVMPVTERKVIDASPRAPTAAQFVLPDTRPVFASIFFSEPVVAERKLVDMPRPGVMATSLTLTEAKPFFATAVLPEPVLPVTEKKVIDTSPRTVATAAFVLPDVKPLFAASLSSQPATVAVAENRMVPDPAPSAVLTPVPAKLVIASAASVPSPVEARTVSAPHAVMTAKLIPAVSLPTMPPVEPVAEKQAVALSIAPLPAKPVLVASASPATPKAVAAIVPAIVVSPLPAKPVAPTVPSVKKTAAVLPAVATVPRPATVVLPPHPVMVASHAAPAVPAPAKLRAPVLKQVASAVPMPARMAPTSKNGKILIGQPIRLFNASGRAGGTGTVLRRLTTLGWTMRATEGRVQPATVLYYSAQNIAAAKALQRTLPFPVRLTADKANSSGMRLVIGRDYLSWKPRNARIAALWQKGTILASLQKPSIRGVR